MFIHHRALPYFSCVHTWVLQVDKSDLVSGVYEGGFKVWEGSVDLVDYLIKEKVNLKGVKVMELGCGHAFPGKTREFWTCMCVCDRQQTAGNRGSGSEKVVPNWRCKVTMLWENSPFLSSSMLPSCTRRGSCCRHACSLGGCARGPARLQRGGDHGGDDDECDSQPQGTSQLFFARAFRMRLRCCHYIWLGADGAIVRR